MACSIGAADRRHATVRPVLVRVMRPASASTSRCFMTAGSDMANGSASWETDTSPLSDRRASSARRVGSASAANVRSRSCNLTMRLSLGRWGDVSRVWVFPLRGRAFVARALPGGVLGFALAFAYCLRASCVAVWWLGLRVGVRVLPSHFTHRRLVSWPSRWHPRFAFVLQASPLCGATREAR